MEMFEIEAKIPLNKEEYDSLDQKLSKLADPLGIIYEINDICDIFGFFRRSKRLLRVREERKNEKRRYILTYKGKSVKSQFKKRKEKERIINRYTAGLFRLFRTLTYKKKRKNFFMLLSTISLDRVIGLGYFIEIESPNEKEVAKIIKKLKIRNKPIDKSYPELIGK
ncbi:CYTH domain-containing protein [Thermoproteota archaeon]